MRRLLPVALVALCLFGVTPATGASQPTGALQSADFLFTEQPASGTQTATFAVPAGTVVLDVFVYALEIKQTHVAGWAHETATLDIGDEITGPHAYYGNIDLVNYMDEEYYPTNLYYQPNPSYLTLGNTSGLFYGPDAYSQSATGGMMYPGPGVRYETDDTITMTVTTTGPDVTPAGETLVKVLYLEPAPVTGA